MNKIIVFFKRIASGSLKRFFNNIDIVHKGTGKSKIYLFFDMLYCILVYGVGYLEYVTFGFAYIKKDKRKTFMTMNDNISIARELNNKDYYEIFDNKLVFNKRFSKYLNREFIDLNDGFEVFEKFCENRSAFFAKQPVSFGGLGVEKIRVSDDTDLKKLYKELIEKKMFLVEEAIIQHPIMNELCDRALNTVRIVTIINNSGVAKFVYSLIRVGNGKTDVDNITSGGMYTLVDSNGIISNPMFCDKTVSYYDIHPKNEKVFKGFKIPFFDQAVEMAKEAALVETNMRYIGWDIGITPQGPVLVEGNALPGYDMCQNHRFHDDGRGMKKIFYDIISS